MLSDKLRNVLSTGADVLSAGDSSCLMHMGGGLSRLSKGDTGGGTGGGTRPVHLAEILAAT